MHRACVSHSQVRSIVELGGVASTRPVPNVEQTVHATQPSSGPDEYTLPVNPVHAMALVMLTTWWPVEFVQEELATVQELPVGIPVHVSGELAFPRLLHEGGPTQYPGAHPHTRSDVAVASWTVIVFMPTESHTRSAAQARSVVAVGAVISYCVLVEHVVTK